MTPSASRIDLVRSTLNALTLTHNVILNETDKMSSETQFAFDVWYYDAL